MPQRSSAPEAARVSVAGTLYKVLSEDDTHLTKQEVMGVLFVVKILVALAVGFTCGVMPVFGVLGFAGYAAASAVCTFLVYRAVLKIDEEEVGGHGALLGEDQNVGLPLFMLTWILTYSTIWW